MEVAGLKQAVLAELLGSASRAAEILNRRLALTTEMVLKVSSPWRCSADSLVRPYHLEAS